MGAATTQSFEEAQGELSAVSTANAAASLLVAAQALRNVPQLASTLSDELIGATDKTALVSRIFGAGLEKAAVTFLSSLATKAWSTASEFAESVETLGVLAVSHGAPDDTASDLLDAADLIDSHWDLTKAIGDRLATEEARTALVARVFEKSVSSISLHLLQYVAATRAAGQIAPTLRTFAGHILAANSKQLAIIRSAIPLSEQAITQLLAPLSKSFDAELVAHTQIDPGLIGGAKVTVGSTVIDGSVQTRLRELKTALAA